MTGPFSSRRPWMPGPLLTTALLGVVLFAVLFSAPADARRKRRPAAAKKAQPMDVAVVPFEVLRGNEGRAASEALELELELVDGVRVQDAGPVAADLEAAKDPLAPTAVKAAMKRRGLEVLVTAPAGFERPWLVAFGADGKPRVVKELPRGGTADQMAATALAALKPVFGEWSTLKAQKLPARGSSVGLRDVLVDGDEEDGDDEGTGRSTDRSTDRSADRTTDRSADRRTGIVDEEDAGTATRRAALDQGEQDRLAEPGRRTLSDVEDEAGTGAGTIKPSHLLALSGTFDGAAWTYVFEGNDDVQPGPVGAGFHPGGTVRGDIWFLPWVGIDASGSLSTVQFQINSNQNLAVAPNRFVSLHTNAGVSARGRYLLNLSDDGVLRTIGLGGRIGYRYWNASAETQRIVSSDRILTVVPGFTMHALTVGPELYVPLFVLDRRFEIELKIDTMPVTRYAEAPDNPGRNSLAFGYHAELLTRFDLFGGFFVELAGKSTGATINFEGEGDRVTVGGNETDLVTLKGGRSVNAAGSFSLGVGFMY